MQNKQTKIMGHSWLILYILTYPTDGVENLVILKVSVRCSSATAILSIKLKRRLGLRLE
jgi:hypothetical protein